MKMETTKLIRKITVGKDYKVDSMHYAVGQEVYGGHTICDIIEEDEEEFVFGDTSGPGFGGPNDPNDTDFSPSQMGGGY